MDKALQRQIAVFALAFFVLQIVFDWIQLGFGPPVAIPEKIVMTVVATALYAAILFWLNRRKNRKD